MKEQQNAAVIERLKNEMSSHREEISRTQKDMKHEISEWNKRVKLIDKDLNADNEAQNWGLLWSHNDRICEYIKSISLLKGLIMAKMDIYVSLLDGQKPDQQ